MTHLDDPILMYACHGKEPNPASSPPTILLCAVCFGFEMPHPINNQKTYKLI